MTSRIAKLAGMLLLTGLFGCSTGISDPTPPPDLPDTAEEFTVRGWQFFESERYDAAVSDFSEALILSSDYAEAMAGWGWSYYKRTGFIGGARSAVREFLEAISAGEDESYVRAGLAAAQLAIGAENLELAITNAGTVLSADPAFRFSHQLSFDTKDLLLIQAFAHAAAGEFGSALAEADLIVDSGIDENIPSTWLIDGTTHTTFIAAVLAHLHQLSELYSG